MPLPSLRAVLPALLGAGLFLAGCAGPRATADRGADRVEGFPEHSLSEIGQRLTFPFADTLHAFRSKARLALRSPAQNGSFSADLRYRQHDSLYMSISPGFGVEAARVLVTPDSFFVYDRIKKELAVGARALIDTFFPLPPEEEVFRSLLGLLSPPAGVKWDLRADDTYYYLTSPDEREQYTVDPSLWRVVRYARRTAGGAVEEERVYAEFDTVGSVLLPRRIVLRRPQDQTNAVIFYRDLSLNPAALSFDLDVKHPVEHVRVERPHEISDE